MQRYLIYSLFVVIYGCAIFLSSKHVPPPIAVIVTPTATITPSPVATPALPLVLKKPRPVFTLTYEKCPGYAACFTTRQFKALHDSLDAEEKYDGAIDMVLRRLKRHKH